MSNPSKGGFTMQYTSGSGDAFSGVPQIEEALKINEIAKKWIAI